MEQVGLRVRNLERSLDFYTRALGLRVRERGDTRSWGGGLWVRLEDPRSHRNLELHWYRRGSLFSGPFAVGCGVDPADFTIGVTPASTRERTYRRLLRMGARPTKYTPAVTGGWMASVLDPDGIWITIGRQRTVAERASVLEEPVPSQRTRRAPS